MLRLPANGFMTVLTLVLSTAVLMLPQARADNPVPLIIQPLSFTSVHPGAGAFTLRVKGDGFVPFTVVKWNGASLLTTFINTREVSAAVPAANVATPGTAAITTFNPAPKGGTSNTVFLPVIRPSVSNAMASKSNSPTDLFPWRLITGDFNHDGKLDLVTVNTYGLSVLFGNGDATFQPPVNYPTGSPHVTNWAITAGDFNGDGKMDLAVVSEIGTLGGFLYIWLGNADGTFQLPRFSMPVDDAPRGIATADFNGDGNLDLAVSSSDFGRVSILLGNGDGTFGLRTDYSATYFPTDLVLGDFNSDGFIDIAVLDGFGEVNTLFGRGDGTFEGGQTYPTSNAPQGMIGADLNGDGATDLIVANSIPETISVFLNAGHGVFKPFVDYPAGGGALHPILADFNGDGRLDIAVTVSNGISILLGNADGTFQAPLVFPTGAVTAEGIVIADFNQDGRLDVAFTDYSGASITTMLQTALSLSPATLTFSLQTAGTSSVPQSIDVKNIDGGSVSLGTITLAGADPGDFAIVSDACPGSLTPAQSCRVKVKFTPTLGGLRTGSLLIPDNTLGVTQTVVLSGTASIVSLSPPKLNFGTVVIGHTSAPLTSRVNNVGMVSLNIFNITIGGPNKADFAQSSTCGATLAPEASCTVTATFTPSASGARTASVTIVDDGNNGAGESQSIALSGSGS